MKKLVAFLSILFASVLCTACINNFAIQELNNKAKEYMEKGDVQSAICRLQSSVDLDGSIFETRYNLGIAYIKNSDFKSAVEQLNAAIKLKDVADVYYSLGVAHEGLAAEAVRVEEVQDVEDETAKPKEPETKEIEAAISHLNDAVKAYQTYLKKAPDAADKEDVLGQIESIEKSVEDYKQKLGSDTAE